MKKNKNIDLDVLFEDEYLVIINKPIGLVVHKGSGVKESTLVDLLEKKHDSLSTLSGKERKGIVHRLDKDTSGAIIIAKDNKTHEVMMGMFKDHLIKREYIALCEGVFPHSSAKIDLPIAKSDKDFSKKEINKSGKEAITLVEVIKRFENYTLLKVNLLTGRTHQIRVHLAYLNHPIYNDPKYGSRKDESFGQLLHASGVEFIHPFTKEKIKVDAEMPKEFKKMIDDLSKRQI